MPQFFFHLRVGGDRDPDEIGVELPGVETAYLEAFATAQEMWTELLAQGQDPTARVFEITDSNGQLVLELPFSEVLERTQRGPAPGGLTRRKTSALLSRTRDLTGSLAQQIEQTRNSLQRV